MRRTTWLAQPRPARHSTPPPASIRSEHATSGRTPPGSRPSRSSSASRAANSSAAHGSAGQLTKVDGQLNQACIAMSQRCGDLLQRMWLATGREGSSQAMRQLRVGCWPGTNAGNAPSASAEAPTRQQPCSHKRGLRGRDRRPGGLRAAPVRHAAQAPERQRRPLELRLRTIKRAARSCPDIFCKRLTPAAAGGSIECRTAGGGRRRWPPRIR